MANFEALCWNIWSNINLLFLKSDEPLIFNKFQKIRIYIGTYLYLLLYLPAPCSFLIFMAISKFDLNMHRVTEFSMHACTWNTCCMKSYHRVSDWKQNYVKSFSRKIFFVKLISRKNPGELLDKWKKNVVLRLLFLGCDNYYEFVFFFHLRFLVPYYTYIYVLINFLPKKCKFFFKFRTCFRLKLTHNLAINNL